jgi:hypothetical protein
VVSAGVRKHIDMENKKQKGKRASHIFRGEMMSSIIRICENGRNITPKKNKTILLRLLYNFVIMQLRQNINVFTGAKVVFSIIGCCALYSSSCRECNKNPQFHPDESDSKLSRKNIKTPHQMCKEIHRLT